MITIGLLSLYSPYYEPVAPNLVAEKRHGHDALLHLLSGCGQVCPEWVASVAEIPAAMSRLAGRHCDVLVVNPTLAVFSSYIDAIIRANPCPVLLVNSASRRHPFRVHQTTMSDLIRHSQALGVEAQSNRLMRGGAVFAVVAGELEDVGFQAELHTQVRMLSLSSLWPRLTFGLIGHRFKEMSDTALDVGRLRQKWPFRFLEIGHDELRAVFFEVPRSATQALDERLRERYKVLPMPEVEWERSLRLAIAYETLSIRHRLAGGALNSHGPSGLDDPDIGIMATLALSLLTEKGVSLGEVGDLQTGMALFFCKFLRWPATYIELDSVDFLHDEWFLANSGELDLGMADGSQPINIRSGVNFRGVCGGGAVFDAGLAEGPATLVSFTEGPGNSHRLIVAEGCIKTQRSPVLELVNAMFKPDQVTAVDGYRQWCEFGAVHHAALTTGRRARELSQLARLLKIDFHLVGPQEGTARSGDVRP